MPNHVKNVIKAPTEVLMSIINEDGNVDFNLVIPSFEDGMGEEISCNAETLAECAMKFEFNPDDLLSRMKLGSMVNFDVRDLSEDQFEQAIQMLKNLRKHGYIHKMHFARKVWGTKWNAYQCEVSDSEVGFETAWNHPAPVIEALSKKFPNDEIKVMYADEDLGANLGSYSIKDGEIIKHDIENETEFAAKLHYGEDVKPEDYGYNKDWVFTED